MDEAAIAAKGTAPLKPYLDRIAAVKDKGELVDLFATVGYPSPIGMAIFPDLSDPTRYGVYAGQAGLGMPNRDYYLLEGAKYDAYRAAYRAYITRIQQLAGIPDAAAKADRIFALETAIAKVHWKPEDSRDISKIYNPMDLAKLNAFAPQLEWDRALAKAGLGDVKTVVVTETTRGPGNRQAARQRAARHVEGLSGLPLHQRPRSLSAQGVRPGAGSISIRRRCATCPTSATGGSAASTWSTARSARRSGKSMSSATIRPKASRQMGELIDNFRAALQEKIETNSWMDAATKKEALAKLATFDPRTGHPAKYIDYSSLKVDRSDLFGNVHALGANSTGTCCSSRMKKPVDRTLWGMTPQTNNAYYDPTQNQITFPAAILQPPYFDPDADAAANYGSIGATIGHEIGHGFDDQGRKFDGTGKLRDWWTAASAKQYDARASRSW